MYITKTEPVPAPPPRSRRRRHLLSSTSSPHRSCERRQQPPAAARPGQRAPCLRWRRGQASSRWPPTTACPGPRARRPGKPRRHLWPSPNNGGGAFFRPAELGSPPWRRRSSPNSAAGQRLLPHNPLEIDANTTSVEQGALGRGSTPDSNLRHRQAAPCRSPCAAALRPSRSSAACIVPDAAPALCPCCSAPVRASFVYPCSGWLHRLPCRGRRRRPSSRSSREWLPCADGQQRSNSPRVDGDAACPARTAPHAAERLATHERRSDLYPYSGCYTCTYTCMYPYSGCYTCMYPYLQ